MQHSNTITVVCVCDNHYAILLAALIKSVEHNHLTGEHLEFLVVEDGITPKNQNKIINAISPGKTSVKWFAMADCLPKNAKLPVDKSSLPLNIYIRLFIPYFIPKDIKKVIFLDVDMIMLSDISVLWNTDLKDNIIAAVQDQFIQVVSRWGGVSNYKELNIPEDSKYFNAGLMVIDIDKWETAGSTNKVINCIMEHKQHALFQDQYGLNAVFSGRWLALDPLWNRFAYSDDEKPFLIHFTGRKPIYKSYEYSEKYKAIFYEYLAMTEWKNFKPIGETSRYIKKLNNFIEKFRNMLSPK